MTSSAKNLRDWLRKMNAYDNDIYEVLNEMGIKYPAQDFVGFTTKQMDKFLLDMKNVRNQKLKDQKVKNSHEKKCLKVKKEWQTISGNKGSMQKKNQKKSKSKSKDTGNTKDTSSLKKWMKKHIGGLVNELLETLGEVAGVYTDKDLGNMTRKTWDKVKRETTVKRNKILKDQQSKNKLQEKLTKFEKAWEKEFNISKQKMATKNTNKKKKKLVEDDETKKLVRPLVEWMKKNSVFVLEIKESLIEVAGITCPDDLKTMTWAQYREVVRVSRVKRNHNTQNQEDRKKLNNRLEDFKKVWKEQFDIKEETMQTDKTVKKDDNKKEDQANFLGRWLRANGMFSIELKDELVKRDVYSYDDLVKIQSQEKCDEIVRMARVERKSNNKSKESSNRLDAQLTRFEKMWQEKTGNVSQIGIPKKKN